MKPEDLASLYHSLPQVPGTNHRWLRDARPSQAFLLCLCSGPWKIHRRRVVQQAALDRLGTCDLTDLSSIDFNFPLGWQRKYYDMAASAPLSCFDTEFRPGVSTLEFQEAFGSDWDKIPKVIALFARDFLDIPCFPVDRHVRDWCKANNIHGKPSVVMELCAAAGVRPGDLSRAIFSSKSENPTDLIFPN